MFETWDNRIEILYMIIFVLSETRHQIIVNLFRIEKEVRNLFSKLRCHLNLNNTCSFSFKEDFSFASFKKTYFWYLQSEVDLLIQTRDKLIKFLHFWSINIKHRTWLFEKLSSFFFNFIILKAHFTEAVFTLWGSIEEVKYCCL